MNESKADQQKESSQDSCKVGRLASCLTSEKRTDPSFWNAFCPSLSIEGKPQAEINVPEIASDEAERRKQKLISDGYVLVDECLNMELVNQIKEGIERLHEQQLPATFILLFDQTWDLARESRKVLGSSSHSKNAFNFDLLAWYIEAGKGGFAPHRDRQPDNTASTFHSDDQPKFITQWIALSEATPENSCLHVIPKKCDPGYVDGDTDLEDPLRRALPDKESFQHIRALPRKPGQSILFTHRIIHWGSKNDSDSTHPPRIAISFVCSDPKYEAPLVKPDSFTEDKIPPFHIRLLLVCAQLLIYYQRFELSKEAIKACYEYCKQYEGDLEENYRQKVFVEFVKAIKETTENSNESTTGTSDGVKLVVTEEGDEEDEEDAMMEEMLNAETGGYGEFEDDYDELEDGEKPEDDENNSDEEDVSEEDDEEDESEEDEDEEGEVNFFGKRTLTSEESNESKKGKAN